MRSWVSGAIAAAASLAACTENGAPLVSGERVAEGRDLMDVWFWRPRSLAYTRTAASGGPSLEDLWVRDLDQPAADLALRDLQWTPPDRWPSVRVENLLVTGLNTIVAYDVEARLSEVFPSRRVALRPAGGELAHWAHPTFGEDIVRAGRLQAEREVAGFLTRAADFMGDDLAAIGHLTQDPAGTQVLARLSPANGAVNVLVPDLPAWTPSPDDLVAARCTSLVPPACRLFQVIGCTDQTAACAGTSERPCAVVFAREAPAGAPVPFVPAVYDVNRGLELPLEGGVSADGFLRSPDGRRVAWADEAVHVWDACTQQSGRCEVGPGQAAGILQARWRPDSGALSFVAVQQTLLVLSVEDGSCIVPTPSGRPRSVFYSPDSRRMGWLDEPAPGADVTLWIGDGLGQGGTPVASGQISSVRFSGDGRFLLIRRFGDLTGSLSVIDFNAASPAERSLATAAASEIAMGVRRLVALTYWNSQDQSGRVELFDLVLGTSTVLAESATDVAAAGSVDGPVDIAYLVHARFPSQSDGMWLARLPEPGAP